MAKIGELLIAEGHLTQDGLEEALDWQVLYGGRLGTNLLELELVPEADLARALGRQLGAEVTWGELQPDLSLLGAIPKHIADRQEIIPWKLEKRRLKVLCVDIKLQQLDELGYRLGRTCQAVIAPEYRIFQALRAHYQAQRQMRALDFGVVPEEGREERRRTKLKQEKGSPEEPAPELIDEGAFNDIYNQMLAGRSAVPQSKPQAATPPPAARAPALPAPRTPAPRAPSQPQPPRATTAPLQREAAPSWQQQSRLAPTPPVIAPAPTQVRSRTAVRVTPLPDGPPPLERRAGPPPEALETLPDDAILEALPDDAMLEEPPAEAEAPLPMVSWEDDPAPPAQPAIDESPLDFKQALKLLEGVSDRDSIAHIVLRASRAKAARALLLQVQGGVALGWDGLGEGLSGGAARAVAIPLSAQSAFSLVVKTRSHYLGPLQKTPSNIRFLAALGKKVPLSSLLVPILHKGRVSHLLYLDNGHRQQAPTDIGEMLILSQRIAQTVDALVARKRKAARG